MQSVTSRLMIGSAVVCCLAACTSGTSVGYPLESPTATQSLVVQTGPGEMLPYWTIGDQPVASGGGYTFAANIVIIDGGRVTVVYSLSGPHTEQPLDGQSVQFTDENGSLTYTYCPQNPPGPTQAPPTYPVPTAIPIPSQTPPPYPVPTAIPIPSQTPPPYPIPTDTPLPPCTPMPVAPIATRVAQLGQLQLGILNFAQHVSGGHQIRLRVSVAGSGNPLEVVAAQLVGTTQNDQTAGAELHLEPMDQAGFRISFNYGDVSRGDQTAGGTPSKVPTAVGTATGSTAPLALSTTTRVPFSPETLALAGGRPIRFQATLRIEDLVSHQLQYLLLVILEGGDTKATLAK